MRLLTMILFLAAGCVGSIGDESQGGGGDDDTTTPPPDTRAAKEIFKADVHPAVAKCSGAGCHDTNATSAALGKFYNTNPDTAYDATVIATTIVSTFSSIAPILTHVQAGHKGLSYTPDETTKITGWLAKETTERKATGGVNQPPPFDPKALLKVWSGCMSQENFNAAGMTAAWSGLAASNLQKCINCHNGAVGGFLIINNATQYFTALSTSTSTLLKYFTVNTADKKVVVNTGSFVAANMISGHPAFNPTTNAGMTALLKFYDSTLLRQTAGTCDPSRLTD
jgi:cytochrome c553